jgi:hypothetical protein
MAKKGKATKAQKKYWKLLDALCGIHADLGIAQLKAETKYCVESAHYYGQAKALVEAALDALDEAAIADGVISRGDHG